MDRGGHTVPEGTEGTPPPGDEGLGRGEGCAGGPDRAAYNAGRELVPLHLHLLWVWPRAESDLYGAGLPGAQHLDPAPIADSGLVHQERYQVVHVF